MSTNRKRKDNKSINVPNSVKSIYEKAFLEFDPQDKRRKIKGCEHQIAQMERRIARKKNQDNHQVLADMKDLHKRVTAIGFTVTVYEQRLLGRFQHTLDMLAALDISFLAKMAPGAIAEDVAAMPEAAQLLRRKSLYEIYKEDYMLYLVGQRIEELMGAEPERQYPEARGMKRHFILHIGPTNSGKTYQALQRLKQAYHGIYLGPLRLLALEVYDRMMAAGIPCDMVTGEETIRTPGSFVQASTVEILNIRETYDIAVIDEAQMMADENRGSYWTRAVLGIRAEEIHVCCSGTAEGLLVKMIRRCGDTFEIVRHERNTKLEFIPKRYDMNHDVEPGDALIAFSKKNVLAIAAALEGRGIKASVIYGNLPPQTRQEQVRLFTEGENQVVVATDAIGMGINLPIRRIVFMNTVKFDGTDKRRLKAEEVRQIAGRAGRYGYYDVGYVQSALDMEYIGKKLEEPFYPLKKARIGFPEVLLDIDTGLDEIMEAWEKTRNLPMYDKISMAESVKKYRYLVSSRKKLPYMDDRKFVLNLITCPFDVKDKEVLKLWLRYCENPEQQHDCPMLPYDFSLEGLESYYKQLDLYTQFAGRMSWSIDRDEVAANREWAQHEIGELLKDDKEQFGKKCRRCGRPLPWDFAYPICEHCKNWLNASPMD
jgi:ATP-dependent RNA helicase SUPV3L1/SUV3